MFAFLKMAGAWVVALLGSKSAKQFLDNRKAEKANLSDHEKALAEQMKGSWKDEYLTIVFTLPIVTIWVGILIDWIWGWHPDGRGQGLIEAGQEMFAVLNGLDDNMRLILMLIVSASFGVHITRVHQKKKVTDAIVEVAKNVTKKKTDRRKQVDEILNRHSPR